MIRTLVIRIKDVLLVTVPPEPDDKIISEIQEHILNDMTKYQSKGLILNISLVEVVDSFFARMIAETADMFKLMGGITVIAGMHPSVAITSTQLGFTMGDVKCARDVDHAFELLKSDTKKKRWLFESSNGNNAYQQ
jgi:rsbT antagonist protein RsbS